MGLSARLRLRTNSHPTMSDTEETPMETAPAVEAAAPAKMDTMTALKEVLRNALMHDGLARGLHEAAKALDKRQAHLCVLASNCDEPAYSKLVGALCQEHGINLLKVPDSKQLGEWVGLCKIDKEGTARRVVACSCAVIHDYGEESDARQALLEHLKGQ